MKKCYLIACQLLLSVSIIFAQSAVSFDRVIPGYMNGRANQIVSIPDGRWAAAGAWPQNEIYFLDDKAFIRLFDKNGQQVWEALRDADEYVNFASLALLSDNTLVGAGITGYTLEQANMFTLAFPYTGMQQVNLSGQTLAQSGNGIADPDLRIKPTADGRYWRLRYYSWGAPAHLERNNKQGNYWEADAAFWVSGFPVFNDFQLLDDRHFHITRENGLSLCTYATTSASNPLSHTFFHKPIVPNKPFVRVTAFEPGKNLALARDGALYLADSLGGAMPVFQPGSPFAAVDLGVDSTHVWVVGRLDQKNTLYKIDRFNWTAAPVELPGTDQEFTSLAVGAEQIGLSGVEWRRRPGATDAYNGIPLLRSVGKNGFATSSSLDAGISKVSFDVVSITKVDQNLYNFYLPGVKIDLTNTGPDTIFQLWLNNSQSALPGLRLAQKLVDQPIAPGQTITVNWDLSVPKIYVSPVQNGSFDFCLFVNAPNDRPDTNHDNDIWCQTFQVYVDTNEQPESQLEVLGNPVRDELHLRFPVPAPGLQTWDIVDMTGRICLNGVIPSGTLEDRFDVRGLASGVYLFRTQEARVRFVKQ